MNILNWILFVLLNVCLTSVISGLYTFSNIFWWCFDDKYIDIAILWLLLSLPVQFVIFPILHEFLNRKSQIFLFLNKLKNPELALRACFLAIGAEILSVIVLCMFDIKYFFLSILCFFVGGLFAAYLGLIIWLRFRKYIFYKQRRLIKTVSKWLDKRKYMTLQNIIILLNLFFIAENISFLVDCNRKAFLFDEIFIIIPLIFIELISVLSFTKKQKAQPFQRGIIFINSFLIFIYTQLAISILFFVDLI